jgi:hypothetical protein
VTIVVPVLMTNCQVSLKLNIGPVMPQTIMIKAAMMNAAGWPVARAVRLAKWEKGDEEYITAPFAFRLAVYCLGGREPR